MTNVVPVASTTLKKSKRNQSPKDPKVVSPNITDQNAQKSSKKSEKAKKAHAEKTPKISKTLTAKPITKDLHELKFVPKWVWENVPNHVSEPKDDKFSFIGLYLEVRHQAELAGKVYYELTISELLDLLRGYANENSATPLGDRIKGMKPLQLRDLKARLQWVMVPTIRQYDRQQQEKKSEK